MTTSEETILTAAAVSDGRIGDNDCLHGTAAFAGETHAQSNIPAGR